MVIRALLVLLPCLLLLACNEPPAVAVAPNTSPADSVASAIQAVEQRIVSTPGDADLYVERANLYIGIDSLKLAINDMQRAVALDSTDAEKRILLGNLYYSTVQVDKASTQLDRALVLEPENTEAIVTHVLAITDQFGSGRAEDLRRAGIAVVRLSDAYKHAYYNGIICERWAKSILERAMPRAHEMAFEWIDKALGWYEKAERLRVPGNDEAILRWNTCVRMLQRDANLKPREVEAYEPSFE